ncbi:hypothetical protein H4R34_002512 [Dimargaris verticillata]|uniref:Uncharacterized protein n=1 Tax=Dimargaris verticillata TaxID=2761393 RepID=A0A9W8B1N7_9FUNG|nr:hypothetical protein H4R34_002512 [Dimargaris verticillata]
MRYLQLFGALLLPAIHSGSAVTANPKAARNGFPDNANSTEVTVPSLTLGYTWTVIQAFYAPNSDKVKLRDCKGDLISTVTAQFEKDMLAGGSGLLNDGQYVRPVKCSKNTDTNYYAVSDRPLTSSGDPLHPFVSIALHGQRQGTIAYIKALDGLGLPLDQTHNGCVQIDETEGLSDTRLVQLYVQTHTFYETINDSFHGSQVTAELNSTCTIKTYKSLVLKDGLKDLNQHENEEHDGDSDAASTKTHDLGSLPITESHPSRETQPADVSAAGLENWHGLWVTGTASLLAVTMSHLAVA